MGDLKSLVLSLCRLPAVSGDEDGLAAQLCDLLAPFMDKVEIDPLGSVIGTSKGQGPSVLLDAHMDQIGMAVVAIDDKGFLKVSRCGGMDRGVLAAHDVTVFGKQPLFGVVTSTPPHLSKDKEKKFPAWDEIAVDIGMTKEQAEQWVSPGDRIILRAGQGNLLGDKIYSPCLDDRCGIAAILRCLELLKEKGVKPNLCVVFSAQEETGGSGAKAAGFTAQTDEAIAVDVSFGLAPGINEQDGAPIGSGTMIGHSPVLDRAMSKRLTDLASLHKIPFSPEVMGRSTGTNADDLQIAGKGIACGLLSIPIRNMHTGVEVASLHDIEATAQLMAAYLTERSETVC